ncbi:hypothetical protein ColTof4_11088 [Colletotrichum tofieldiae]|nr:hypothetical protein ColTof3_04272 [Colletotrichum tofieldiae]GKT78665.1 hypothetical protein ColTof4_11088 [Colletotrichum tofieldiae]GKT87132.1 hypothetical protein Ct61P_04982 [Colletotrichum tofieldiae]
MTAFVTWGYNFASSPPPPPIATAAEPKTTSTQAQSPRKHFYMPRWLFLTVKVVLALAVVGLCVTGIIMLTDFFELTWSAKLMLANRIMALESTILVGTSTMAPFSRKNGVKSTRGLVIGPARRVLLPGLCALIPEWIILVNGMMGLVFWVFI